MPNVSNNRVARACRKLVMLAANGFDVTDLAREVVTQSTFGDAENIRHACLSVDAAEISWRSHRG